MAVQGEFEQVANLHDVLRLMQIGAGSPNDHLMSWGDPLYQRYMGDACQARSALEAQPKRARTDVDEIWQAHTVANLKLLYTKGRITRLYLAGA